MLTINEHFSPHYGPRTFHNASYAGLTVAIAAEFDTAGEKLTHKAAKEKYIAIPINTQPIEAARKLYSALKKHDAHILNVAGNGIYTLARHGWEQYEVNDILFSIIAKVQQYWRIEEVVSGGQTGVDIAGIVAATALGIKATATFPKGYIQRAEDRIDRQHTKEEIEQYVLDAALVVRNLIKENQC